MQMGTKRERVDTIVHGALAIDRSCAYNDAIRLGTLANGASQAKTRNGDIRPTASRVKQSDEQRGRRHSRSHQCVCVS